MGTQGTIIMPTVSSPIDDRLWAIMFTDEEKEKALLKQFYKGKDFFAEEEILNENIIGEAIIYVLEKYSCQEILDIISEGFTPHEIFKKDVCQFSDFDVCYYKAIHVAIASGFKGISFEKMGFILRTSPRNAVADKKYGENQGKTAVQLGLLANKSSTDFWPSPFGKAFDLLPKERKDKLKAKLCLHIPIIQNYFVLGQDEDLLESYINLLAPSTQGRRKGNVRLLINIVKQQLEDEL